MRILALVWTIGCGTATVEKDRVATTEGNIVYGNDDRLDVYAHPDTDYQALAQTAVVALTRPETLDMSDPNNVRLASPQTLQESEDLCPGQRFEHQPAVSFCSGTLIAPDLVLTAGHCVTDESCARTTLLFNYLYADEAEQVRLTADDVYQCQAVLVRERRTSGQDYAVIRLDRPAASSHVPAPVRSNETTLAAGTHLGVMGFPNGLPLKIDTGGKVRNGRASKRDFFVGTTDTFANNSGSGVYVDHQVAGILVRGESSYRRVGNCNQMKYCTETGCRGEDITYVFNVIHALCGVGITLAGATCP